MSGSTAFVTSEHDIYITLRRTKKESYGSLSENHVSLHMTFFISTDINGYACKVDYVKADRQSLATDGGDANPVPAATPGSFTRLQNTSDHKFTLGVESFS